MSKNDTSVNSEDLYKINNTLIHSIVNKNSNTSPPIKKYLFNYT